MSENIISNLSKSLKIDAKRIEAVLKLLEEGNTIPFIARYRKEATGALDEEIIRTISETYEYEVALQKRKEDVIRLIDEKQMLTEELKADILACTKLVEVEDIYRPFKEKKKTKASEAIKMGLEPLAKQILEFKNIDLKSEAKNYLTEEVKTVEDALQGAMYIIAEMISDNANYRKWIRSFIKRNGKITSKLKKNANDENKTYQNYYDASEEIIKIKHHRLMAINRGEKEGILTVNIDIDEADIIKYLEEKEVKQNTSEKELILEAIKDSYKRLIFPSIEREIRTELKEAAEENAIVNFAGNLENLLMTPPITEKVVLGFDPAFRTGCKLAVLDPRGKPLKIEVIYPTEPHLKIEESKKILLEMIDKYSIDIIAIGNGTASRESEVFVADSIKDAKRKVEYIIVNEAGASVYSASPLAITEFPDLTVEKRSAISIGRRLQDALSELVKIDPKSIGVGLYQHDVTAKRLDESLAFVVEKIVNRVGVNINTASQSILAYISGMNKKAIEALLTYRDQNGKITSRKEVAKIKGVSAKVFEQAIGFMRIVDGENLLDKTSIHPESYKAAEKIMKTFDIKDSDIGTEAIKEKLKGIDSSKLSEELSIDKYTIEDILQSLEKPIIDPRDNIAKPLFKTGVLTLEDLQVGDKLEGTVRNVVDFGAFIDIGLHNDGLAHISKMAKRYIKHPSEVVAVGDIVTCYVEAIDRDRKKVNLSLIPLE